jgi:hypothetical protein
MVSTESVQAETLPAYHLRGLGLFELHAETILEGYQGAAATSYLPVPSPVLSTRYALALCARTVTGASVLALRITATARTL